MRQAWPHGLAGDERMIEAPRAALRKTVPAGQASQLAALALSASLVRKKPSAQTLHVSEPLSELTGEMHGLHSPLTSTWKPWVQPQKPAFIMVHTDQRWEVHLRTERWETGQGQRTQRRLVQLPWRHIMISPDLRPSHTMSHAYPFSSARCAHLLAVADQGHRHKHKGAH